ncbi:DinB family protein [Hymenobacter taeanensis]|uniref:DinB family protein n=1 Tax=Hymenobacter taeanensis TaxID=2735321 RepID=A0A6M6BG21_9BACT|nr:MULTISPECIES: DinB family protein [Hymenobacter]QJX46919.1 DinB family protein [Hymenobacter taeanensis]UOQ80793.1 DinB family protein [Hymenobacter sp. 5414T-23]
MQSTAFLADIQHRLATIEASVQQLLPLPKAVLNHKSSPESWSVLECLEHLNRYGRYYLPALQRALGHSKASAGPGEEVGFSWLGRKSYELVRPDNRKAQKTLGRMNPAQSHLTPAVVQEFQAQVTAIRALLPQAAQANLNQKAVPVEFFRLLKLRVGEALLFVVAHMQRHVQQAERAAATASQKESQPA